MRECQISNQFFKIIGFKREEEEAMLSDHKYCDKREGSIGFHSCDGLFILAVFTGALTV